MLAPQAARGLHAVPSCPRSLLSCISVSRDGRSTRRRWEAMSRTLTSMGWILQPAQCIVEALGGSTMLETLRPDPTFYPSPKLAMEAPAENYAYVLMLSPDGSQPMKGVGRIYQQTFIDTYAKIAHL